MSKYADVIANARKPESQNTSNLESQNASHGETQETSEPAVNLTIKVSKRLRRHWASEAKRQDITLTAAIVEALTTRFGTPQE